MKTGESGREPLIVAGEAAEAAGPSEGALDHPAPGQEHKAALGFLEEKRKRGRSLVFKLFCIGPL